MIYFDNAATTQMSDVAIEALLKVSKENFGNASSIYSYGRKSRKILEESRRIISECIGANSEEIYFTSGGTEGDNWAVSQAVSQNVDYIITSPVEHHAILNPVKNLENTGMRVTYLPVDRGCVIDTNALKVALNGNKAFVSLMFQNNETGVIQPIKQATQIVHNDNLNSVVHTDAVQAIGHTKIDVKDLGVDMLSASAHKFNGPKGVGFLYIRKGLNISSLIAGGGQENGLRSGTENVASIFSMAKALEDNVNNIETHSNKIRELEKRLFGYLNSKRVHYWINGDINKKAPGIINVAFEGIEGEALLNVLDAQDIFISTGSACNSESQERSHVLTAMGLDLGRIDSSVRISIGIYNTDEEMEILGEKLYRYVKMIYKMND